MAYLDKNSIIQVTDDVCKRCDHDKCYRKRGREYCPVMEVIDGIKDLSAADVQPVKCGKWEETHISLCKWIPEDEKEEGHSFYMAELKCSCCKRYNAVTFVLTLDKPDFCQLCGARMDGDSK